MFLNVSGFEKKRPKFEGVLEVNSILAQTQRLYEGQLVGAESLAADSTGDQTLQLILCLILEFIICREYTNSGGSRGGARK